MIRWKYVVPRLGLLTTIALAVWFCMDWALKITLIQAGQLALGSRLTVDSLDTRLTRADLVLEGVVAAHPDAPFRNLFEFDRAVFDLDVSAALRKKLVVHRGLIEGLRFDTARGDSGQLEASHNADERSPTVSVTQNFGERSEAWFNDSLDKLRIDVSRDLQTVKLANEFKERWPRSYHEMTARAKQIERQGRQLRDQLKAIADDPLVNLNQVQPALGAIESLRGNITTTHKDLVSLELQVQKDRRDLKAAQEHDFRYVKQRLHIEALDADSLTEYLLGSVWSERVDSALHWIEQSRPATVSKIAESPSTVHGFDILFPGFSASADVVVRELKLAGSGTVDGSPYGFTGTIRDLTHQPKRHPRPATIEIESNGAIQMIATGTLDRRGEHPVDRYVVQLPSIGQNGQLLGSPEKLAVYVTPGRTTVNAEVVVKGEQLSGTIRFRQPDLRLEPRFPDEYTRFVSPESIQSAVADVQQLEGHVELSGTLRKPQIKVYSNLGPQLAAGLNRAVQREIAVRQQQFVNVANQKVERELGDLQRQLTTEHGNILNSLEIGGSDLDRIKRQLIAGLGSPDDLIRRGRNLFK